MHSVGCRSEKTVDITFEQLFSEYEKLSLGDPMPENFTGKWQARHNGVTVSEREYVNGIKNGVEKLYYLNSGRIMALTTYQKGVKSGLSERYQNTKSSEVISRCTYLNDKIFEGAALIGHGGIDPLLVLEQDEAYEVLVYKDGISGDRVLSRKYFAP